MLKIALFLLTILFSVFSQAEVAYSLGKQLLPSIQAQKTIKFNLDQSAINPLYQKTILHQAVFNGKDSVLQGSLERPIVVLKEDPNSVYMINQSDEPRLIISALNLSTQSFVQNIPDALGKPAQQINSIATAAPYIFALTNGQNLLDQREAAVALLAVGTIDLIQAERPSSFTGLFVLDAPSGRIANESGNRAASLNLESECLKIGQNLTEINASELLWHEGVEKLYVACDVKGGNREQDGARSIAVGSVNRDSNILSFKPIAQASIFDEQENFVVGKTGSQVQVSARNLLSFKTEAGLSYLVAIGGVGDNESTSKKVFCLPLVNGGDDANRGMIASKNAQIIPNPELGSYELHQVATLKKEMPKYTDPAVLVGAGELDSPVVELFERNGSIVCVTEKGNQTKTFSSRPLFEKSGKIICWSEWQ